jgi:diphthine synthase
MCFLELDVHFAAVRKMHQTSALPMLSAAPNGIKMLSLVGLGISSAKDISLAGLEVVKNAEIVFAENYTNAMMDGTLGEIEKMTGKKITVLQREDVEGEKEILADAKAKSIVLLVPGDPMIATTHVSLLIAAKKKGIATKIVHSSSILSAAIGESGLQAYKFGKMTTLAAWKKNYEPTSTIDTILENLGRNLHTLVLIDIVDVQNAKHFASDVAKGDVDGEPMELKEALRLLLKMAERTGGNAEAEINDGTKVVLLCQVGWPGQKIIYGSIASILDGHEDEGPAVIIVPAKLHFLEEEYLEGFAHCCGL